MTDKIKQVHHTELDHIVGEGEAEFLDNGVAMTIEQRDEYFTRAVAYAKKVETILGKQSCRRYDGMNVIDCAAVLPERLHPTCERCEALADPRRWLPVKENISGGKTKT